MERDSKHKILTLPDNRVDIWCTRLSEFQDPEFIHTYGDLLTSEEKVRFSRFMFEKDRHQYLLTRALERDVLSRYVGVEARALVFTRNGFGKPMLMEPDPCSISYSLSHTTDLSVCAVSSGQAIGVDVESLQRASNHETIAKRFFTESESTFLESLEGGEQSTEFLRLWTLKEAFIKAVGLGLALPLNSFELETFSDRPPKGTFSKELVEKGERCRFLQIRLGNSFHLSLAMLKPGSDKIGVNVTTLTPFGVANRPIFLEPNPLDEWVIQGL